MSASRPQPSATAKQVDAVVIGAGFSGMYMLHKLRDQLGLSVQVIERAAEVGGTWYWNRYPGARCDSESYIYCFSFNDDLLQEWEWSGKYPEQPEILRYLNFVADRLDLRRNIAFDTSVESAHYNEANNSWTVTTSDGEHFQAQYLITGIGCLSTGQVPKIPGLDQFAGQWYHTGAWPHEGVDFSGKRVGVIGTGSSGVQSIPVIAAQADHLTVFQRTPQFTVPARHETVDKAYLDDIKANYGDIWEIARNSYGGYPYHRGEESALAVSDEEREARYEAAWQRGGFRFFSVFNDISLDRRANDTASEFIRRKIRAIVKDPDTAEKLMPTDYPFAAKRPLIDTDYFETYNRDNVELVDIRHCPIETITERGVRTADGTEHPVDILVFATGFDAMTGSFFNIDIRGRGGVSLRDAWAEGPKSYLGLAVHGFPNLFTITGPGSPSVLCNMPVCIEQHVEWIADLIAHAKSQGITQIEAEPTSQEDWVRHVNEIAAMTLFVQADSWYLGANIPGKPRVFMPYPGGMGNYRIKCDEVAASGYPGFSLLGPSAPEPRTATG